VRALDEGKLVIAPNERVLQLRFSAPSFRFSDGLQFRYRLEGRDGDWVSAESDRIIRIVGVRPGRYIFHLEVRAPGGVWRAAEPLVLDFTPLFTELVWPRVLLGTLLLVLAILYSRQRVRAAEAMAKARETELQGQRVAASLAAQHQREIAQVSRVAVAGELTASLSHELGQPLAAIVNNAEVARRLIEARAAGTDMTMQRADEALRDVVQQGRRASQVVREFRRFLKRERGQRDLLTMQELLDSATVMLRQAFSEAHVALEVRIAPGTPALLAERVLLQQVMVNLLQNAIEGSRHAPAAQVLVRARPAGDGVRVTVVDNGSGFAADVRRSAFEPFVTTRSDGMGMGLAIARRVVDAQGGHIAVGHLPGAGAVVSLWLPLQHTPSDHSDRLVPLQVTAHA
jgi:signal transduction histidine kinase